MKDKIEEIILQAANMDSQNVILEKDIKIYADKILTLFRTEIESKKDEIAKYIFNNILLEIGMGKSVNDYIVAQDIINIIIGDYDKR